MRNAITRILGGVLTASLLVAGMTTLSGCDKPKPKPKPVAPAPPPPPPAPKQLDAGALLQTMRADQRIQFPNEKAPGDESVARSVIDLATALVKGDDKAMGNLLVSTGKDVLDALTSSGAWEEATSKIEVVRVNDLVAPGEKPQSFDVEFAIQEPGTAYLVKFKATLDNGRYLFDGAPSNRETRTRAIQFDRNARPEPVVSAAPPAAKKQPAEPSEGDIPGQKPLKMYLRLTVAQKFDKELASASVDDMYAQVASRNGRTPAQIKAYVESGKREAEEGRLLAPAEMVEVVDYLVRMGERRQLAISEDDALKAIADACRSNVAAVRERYEQGKK